MTTRAAKGAPSRVWFRAFTDEDPLTFSATPTATVVDWLGVSLGPATVTPADTPGVFSVLVGSASNASVHRLTVNVSGTIATPFAGESWSTSIRVDVDGAPYFDLGELRQAPGMSKTRWTLDDLTSARAVVADRLEEFVGTSMVVTPFELTGRAADWCTSSGGMMLPERFVRSVAGISVDGDPADLSGLAVGPEGVLSGVAVKGDVVTVRGTRGYSDTPPADVREALVQWAAQVVLRRSDSTTDRRQTSISNEFGNISVAQASTDSPSGVPDIDAVLRTWRDRLRLPGFA